MKFRILLFILFVLYFPLTGQVKERTILKLNFNQLEPYLHRQSDTLYIVNFWATWCVPCREELPAFEKVRVQYTGQKLKILLVSLDDPRQMNTALRSFLNKKNIQSEVILLDDTRQNIWIDKVNPEWSGSLPFTMIYNSGFRESFERSLSYQTLDSIINLKLKRP
jgi:thiol-disulfide isomerase/thioredoxin